MVPPFLTLALERIKWLVSHTYRFALGEKASCIHWIGGCVGPRTHLDVVKGIETLLLKGIEPRQSSP
jgi:hypothetical protein